MKSTYSIVPLIRRPIAGDACAAVFEKRSADTLRALDRSRDACLVKDGAAGQGVDSSFKITNQVTAVEASAARIAFTASPYSLTYRPRRPRPTMASSHARHKILANSGDRLSSL
ncbi:Hypothetical protein NTJ_10617 [Nesidiocoris tenuis]|uniref:Uncharacterized protein n=1 Tax=Nesidiocoris tenuis TaxID=355587 RepID=A0ABN7B0P6_9HEMI|nr:Hypothetical protein NTJ_10617 [Nesidiocoris tenuis]